MKNTIRIALLFVIFLGVHFVSAQKKPDVILIKPVRAKVEVIGVLEGNNHLAVLRIMEVDSNAYLLEKNSEVLASFYFTTKPTSGEPKLPGLKNGDIAFVKISGSQDNSSGQMDYTVFEYELLTKETPSSPEVPKSQK